MPIYTVPKRSNFSSSSQQHHQENASARNRFGQQFISSASENERSNPLSQTFNKAKEMNKTYVLSACSKQTSPAISAEGRLTLQRTVTGKGQSDISTKHNTEDTPKEKRLTLQRRMRTGSMEKYKTSIYEARTESPVLASQKNNTSVLPKTNSNDIPVIKTDFRSVKHLRDVKVNPETTSDLIFNCNGLEGIGCVTPLKHKTVVNNFQVKNEISNSSLLITLKSDSESSVLKLVEKRNSSKENSTETRQRLFIRNEDTEKQKAPRNVSAEETKYTSKGETAQNVKNSATSVIKKKTCPPTEAQKRTSPACAITQISKHKKVQGNAIYAEQTASVKDDILSQNVCPEESTFKIENSKVTVAVRVRPFSIRDKNEEKFQVISMTGQETVVHHPDSKQIYRFTFDFSFWSFDKCHNFASQEMVYRSLAGPLLERAFDGYNTCLFAYGQTGSGKSYTMMGFDEDERGIIPRFCEDLFSRITERETPQIAYHLEMSYFEVYNERIHDLLIFEAENGQKKQPLRVREHPVFGPYVEDLTVNAVCSYSDIQKWLQLGNKHRATAATGMNDKSSRSHSVVTLVMTQTKTETVEKEDHEHRIISRVNLIDLAGSERCSASQTSGERLKEGASINKSLFTLGKVISALSEQNQSRKKMFIPYRESVLTWLLKESLGGNSKTAMIATISPAARNIEETLSTLRYAKQACFIVNIAKVNEDINAKLIRELKAEIEKLKSAQKKIQNGDPEKQRAYMQEITSLRVKLHQQEKEMAEMQRAWKEKLEQAEKKKFEGTMELQKAGITFKVDNSLPNLVNLNEDPQLSEMLLYMIKEGQTTVGKSKPNSCHDIQLSGVLIADDHCIIKHRDGAVSITPLGEAKTYVNGRCISRPTFLHHGDRIILGGDHYFRFNHPVEVEKTKSRSCGASLPEDGLKGFEFAKNEWLAAQRAQLELEIEEARLKAKEEMMQGIQIAKEMAQEELSTQQKIYENQIKSLEAQLEEESRRKQMQEKNNQVAENKIQELEKAKRGLEIEVHFNRKRLEMETLAAREVLEDHTIRRAKILEALEAEKHKIAQEVDALQQSVEKRNKMEPNWNSLKLSMMIKEANTISSKLEKHTVFCRHDIMDKGNGNGPSIQVQVRNIRLGVETFWSLEKFEDKLAAMKEVYEMNDTSKADAIFYDPSDEWEPDLSNVSVSSFSKRRSLRNSKRISGCLSELKMNLHNSYLSGSSNKLSNPCSDPPGLFLPKLCKDLIGSALDILIQTHDGEEEDGIAQNLLETLFTVSSEVSSLAETYEQAEESQDNIFIVDQAAQSCSIKITSDFKQFVILTRHWLTCFPKNDEFVRIHDELRENIKHLGGFLQLLFQGGCSDLSSIVAEAQKKIKEKLKHLVKNIAYLAVLNGSRLHLAVENRTNANNIKKSFMPDICSGMEVGLDHLLECIQKKSRIMQKELLKWYQQDEIQEQIKNKAVDLAKLLEDIITDYRENGIRNLLRGEESVDQDFRNASNKAVEFLELHHCLDQAYQAITSSLEGSYRNRSPFRYFIEKICILARNFDSLSNSSVSSIDRTESSVCKIPLPPVNQSEMDTVARSLIISFELELGQNSLNLRNDCKQNVQSERKHPEIAERTNIREPKGIPGWKSRPWSRCESLGESSPSETVWV